MPCIVLKASVTPCKIYSGALPAFILFAAVSVSMVGNVSMRGSGADAAATDNKAEGGGNSFSVGGAAVRCHY